MKLIDALVCGIAGAGNGTASLYKRGTSTRATWYSDFEATVANSSGADIVLDSNGGAEVYVNELVDVRVRNLLGATVRDFTAGEAAGSVEVISQSFTGQDYVSGASAASKPTTLQAVLDAWKTSAGALDFKVSDGGTTKTIQQALTGDVFFNVKDSDYGALGDGTTDDVTAIQDAIDAANAAGGGTVYFPASTYRITATLVLKPGVSLLGDGPSVSIVQMDSSADNSFETSGTPVGVEVRGLLLNQAQSNSGKLVYSTEAIDILFTSCQFGDTNYRTSGNLIDLTNTSSRVSFSGCEFYTGQSNRAVEGGAQALLRCRFTVTGSPSVTGLLWPDTEFFAILCSFDVSGSGAILFWLVESGLRGAAIGNYFTGTLGVGNSCFYFGNPADVGGFTEVGNTFNLTTGRPYLSAVGHENTIIPRSRYGRYANYEQSGGGTLTLDARDAEIIRIDVTDTTSFQISSSAAVVGLTLILLVRNESGGTTSVISWDSSEFNGIPAFTLTAGQTKTFFMVNAEQGAGNATWVPIVDPNPTGWVH